MDEKQGFILPGQISASCVVCGAAFAKSEKSHRTVCSPECKQERGRRYSRKYRRDALAVRDQVLAMFGGRKPTKDELLDLIRRRKGKP